MSGLSRLSILGMVLLVASLAQPAHAYIGPGAGLGAIAVLLALVVGFALLIVGLVWFPLKRRLKRSRKPTAGRNGGGAA